MRHKWYVFVLLVFMTTLSAACTSNSSMGISETQKLVEQVRTVEESEFDLIYFNKPYKRYFKAVNEVVSDEYWVSISEEIVFGYDDVTYTRDDLVNMTQEEYDKHKDRMLRLIRGTGMDKLSANVHISDVYTTNQPNQANIYTVEKKELKDQPFTTTTKKYTLEKRNEEWLITDVVQDMFSYGSEQSAVEREEGVRGLKYQAHDGEDIDYPTVIVLSGVGED